MTKTTEYKMYLSILDAEEDIWVDVEHENVPEQIMTLDQEHIPAYVEIHSIKYGNMDITEFFNQVQMEELEKDILGKSEINNVIRFRAA